jgi:hypothetical protein
MYRLISREAHLTKASALLRLDAVICCVAVCYHIVYGCLAGWPLRVHTPRLIPPSMPAVLAFCDHQVAYIKFLTMTSFSCLVSSHGKQSCASQRSLHNAPIFRLLLKVAVNGTHQCDFQNFCGGFGSQHTTLWPGRINISAVCGSAGSAHAVSWCGLLCGLAFAAGVGRLMLGGSRSVLGWGAAREDLRVLSAFCLFGRHVKYQPLT